MELQNITNLIELQGVEIIKIDCDKANVVELWVLPNEHTQNCPCCKSDNVIRNGKDGLRTIQHLPLCDKICNIIVPKIRLRCKNCMATFNWQYEFVEGKSRYTNAVQSKAYLNSIGSTVKKASDLLNISYSTIERFFKKFVMNLAPLALAHAMEIAEASTKLILGIDDFAIRKGHTYNTGIHNLRGEMFMAIIKGRTLKELLEYAKANPDFKNLKPFAVVMDLAKQYHRFVSEIFPDAIRVADRFHVNGYIIDALNKVRRRVGKTLSTQASLDLKRHKHILNKRNENLTEHEKQHLERLLSYSDELKAVYWHKEELAQWYDCSANYQSAAVWYDRWLDKGLALNIPELNEALKTFKNWKQEILNYHLCRFTNGIVEGRNGKIKSLQRRHFFLQNRDFYEALIILETNAELAMRLFNSYIG